MAPLSRHSDIQLSEQDRFEPYNHPAGPSVWPAVRPLFSSSRSEQSIMSSPALTMSAPRSHNELTETAATSLISTDTEPSNLTKLLIAEIDAEIEASQHPPETQPTPTPLSLGDAKTRIRQFLSSPAYIAYINDLAFSGDLAKTHRDLNPVSTNGRIAAFEHSKAYLQYLEDMELMRLYGGEVGNLRVEDGGAKSMNGEKKGKERETGHWSKQWFELGVGDWELSGEE